MESKESEKGEIERLAEMRAKRRMDSWSERFKSWWLDLPLILAAAGFGWLAGSWNLNIGVTILALLIIGGPFIWFFHHRHKAWERSQFQKFYEEELLELKLKK